MDEGESRALEGRRRSDRIGVAVLVATAGWVAILVSIVVFVLRWRVVHEPGAGDGPVLFAIGIFSLVLGTVGFVGGQVALVRWRAGCGWLALVWGVAAALALGGLFFSPALLLLLV